MNNKEDSSSISPSETIGMILLVFVGLLLTGSVRAFDDIILRLSDLGCKKIYSIPLIVCYWLNILRICLGYAGTISELKAGYHMGIITFLVSVAALVLTYISVDLISSRVLFQNIIGSEKLTWSCFYLLPHVAYLFWDSVLFWKNM